MAKHSKVKNTGILFELLVRQITTDTLNNIETPPAIAIIKEYFGKATTLKRELHLYQTVLKEKYTSELKAGKFIDIVLEERAKLNSTNLRREKYNLIREIKSKYDLTEFFSAKIHKYKQNAAIFTLFETSNTKAFISPKNRLKSRAIVLEEIIGGAKTISTVDKVVEAFRKEDKDLRLLAYKVLVDKFNDKYNKLSEEQASILREYINNISNTEQLRKNYKILLQNSLKTLN